jgi:hypothetical protein
MRTTLAIASATILIACASAFAQSSTGTAAASPGAEDGRTMRETAPHEGRAATQDSMRPGNPNGKGNALNGPSGAPDATRNNGQ